MSDPKPAAPRGASLTLRLIGAALVWMLILLSAGGIFLATAFRDSATVEFGQRLEALLHAMIAVMDSDAQGGVVIARPLGDPRFDRVFSGWYWQVAEPSGRLVRSRSLWDSALPTSDDGSRTVLREITGPRGEPLLAIERDLRFAGAAGPVHVVIAGDLSEVNLRVRRFDLLLVSALGVFAAAMALAVFLQVRFGLQPLRRLVSELDGIRTGRTTRLAGRYPREVGPLVEAMNAVLDHDAALIDRARTHVGNLAHSLKTPLAVLRAELEGVPRRAGAETQLATMARLIEHHLARAASSAQSARALGAVTFVAPVIGGIAEVLARVHADRAISADIDIPAELAWPVAREDAEEMLGNLMENAWKWARSGVRVTGHIESERSWVSVEDDGPGLTSDEAEAATRRGARLDEAMPGWGLGLAIASDVAALNGGTLDLAKSELGGVKATVSLGRSGDTLSRAS